MRKLSFVVLVECELSLDLPLCVSATYTGESGNSDLVGPATEKDHLESYQDDGQIQREGKVLDIVQLIFELAFCVFDIGSILILYLRPASDSWSDAVPAPIHRNYLLQHLAKFRLFWAWANQTHFATQDIDQLRQFIQTKLSQ